MRFWGANVDKHWQRARKVLCVRLDSMGDVLMTTPAIRAVKEAPTQPKITLLTSSAGAEVGKLIPEVDDVLVYDAPWVKSTPARQTAAKDWVQASYLRDHGFDAAIIFCVFSQNPLPAALLCYLADIPVRLAHSRENPYQLLTHWVPDPEPAKFIRHEVQRHLDLVKTIGCVPSHDHLSVRFSLSAVDFVARELDSYDVRDDENIVVIHAGASAPSRRYPPERFAWIANQLAVREQCRIVFTGSKHELALVNQMCDMMNGPAISFAGELNVEQLAALLARASLLISNNTGPAHLAAAVQTPIVELYALTNPQHTPWNVKNRVLFADVPCKYCYRSVCPEGHNDCLNKVDPESVVAAAQELLKEGQYVYARN